MGLKNKRSRPWLSRLHFLIRLLGLTGLLAVAVGLVLARVQGLLGTPEQNARQRLESLWQRALAVLQGKADADVLASTTTCVLLGGAAVALLWLLLEGLSVLRFTAARRSAFGFNALVQVGVAALLLVGLNVYSFGHHLRVDCTRDKQFTLPADVQDQLRRLRGETTIVVLQQRRKTDTNPEFEDYRSAAEAVVVEKVRDLAEQLRAFGPDQFKVVLLDARQKNYRSRLAEVTEGQPKLAAAIKNAPGNSIFFYARDDEDKSGRAHVQRLGFDDFYQLDRTRSQKAHGGKGNLVLLKKGVGPLARRIFNLEEKRPRIGILVVHEVFSTEGSEPTLALGGLKKTLAQHGFDVRNVVLKRLLGVDPRRRTWRSEPLANTLEETQYDRLRKVLDLIPLSVRRARDQIKGLTGLKERLEKAKGKPAALALLARQLRADEITEEERETLVKNLQSAIGTWEERLKKLEQRKQKTEKEIGRFNADAIAEQRRMADLRAKLARVADDCDLLLIPRLTVRPDGFRFADTGGLFRLEDFQVGVVKEFLKSGKPVLVCSGPMLDPAARFLPDGLEELLAELHIRLGKDTVLFDVQTEESAQRANEFLSTADEVPPLDFSTPLKGLKRLPGRPISKEENPLRESLRLVGAARGNFDLRLRYARPIYYDGDRGQTWKRYREPLGRALAATPLNPLALLSPRPLTPAPRKPLKVAPEFLWTNAASWNDTQTLPNDDRPVLSYEAPKENDPARGTLNERRRGPFPVGVAVEADLPRSWYARKKGAPHKTRVAVIGSGGVFVDAELSPAREKLLLDTCNWLLKRDDLLTRQSVTWSYPRLSISKRDKDLWLWGTRLGLPMLFAYLGLVVLLARRVR